MTNCYYGGKLASFPTKKAEFTATEERIIEIVSDGIGRCLENAWKDLMPITIRNIGREVNPQFATLVEATDSVIICSFVTHYFLLYKEQLPISTKKHSWQETKIVL